MDGHTRARNIPQHHPSSNLSNQQRKAYRDLVKNLLSVTTSFDFVLSANLLALQAERRRKERLRKSKSDFLRREQGRFQINKLSYKTTGQELQSALRNSHSCASVEGNTINESQSDGVLGLTIRSWQEDLSRFPHQANTTTLPRRPLDILLPLAARGTVPWANSLTISAVTPENQTRSTVMLYSEMRLLGARSTTTRTCFQSAIGGRYIWRGEIEYANQK